MSTLTLTVACGTMLLGMTTGVLGCFAVLRRRALVGDVLAHAALPGLCLAFLWIGGRHFGGLLIGAAIAGTLGVALVTALVRWTRTKEDAAIGIVLSTFFGAGVVLLSVIQRQAGGGSPAGLETYIYGQAATMSWTDVRAIAGVSAIALLIVLLLFKEFQLFSFDAEYATTQGWPPWGLELAMMGTLAAVTVVALPAVGVVLTAALLIIPPATARLWTERLATMLWVAGCIGAACGLCGTLISASGGPVGWLLNSADGSLHLPTGPLVILTGTVIFGLSLLVAPERGWIARVLELSRVRRLSARENLLRSLYELSEPQLPERRAIKVEALQQAREWSQANLPRLLRWSARRGWVESVDGGVRLTPLGLQEAAALTRRHRLWELYLIQQAEIAPERVDRAADSVEHFLSPSVVARLEAMLAAQGRLPALPHEVPASPHALAPSGVSSPPDPKNGEEA